MDTLTADDALTCMHARILRCPRGNNPTDCPLHEIRKMPLEDRLSWLYERSAAEIMDLYQQHTECFENQSRQSMPKTD